MVGDTQENIWCSVPTIVGTRMVDANGLFSAASAAAAAGVMRATIASRLTSAKG
jgi:hypothetical protein